MITEAQAAAVQAALDDIEEEQLLEYQFLFALAGRLRGLEPGLRQNDRRAPQRLLPVALEFAHQIDLNDLGKGFIDWSDEDSVALEFTKAWTSRRLPKDASIFDWAIALSLENPLQLSPERNKWVNRIANLAFCLSEMLPDTAALIPINDRTAEKLGLSLRTLSLAVQELIREKLLLVLEKPDQTLPRRRARRFKFNVKHPLVANTIDGSRKRLRDLIASGQPKAS